MVRSVTYTSRHAANYARDIQYVAGSPPAHIDGADADVGDPARMLFEHARLRRIVGAQARHVVRREVDGRTPTGLVPVPIRRGLVPRVVLEDEVTSQIGEPIVEQARASGLRRSGRHRGGGPHTEARGTEHLKKLPT